jgi:hypothetical protein
MPKTEYADRIRAELERIASNNNGRLTAELVVKEARSNKRSVLHTYKGFHGWDRGRAAEEHWLDVGRTLIKKYVTIMVRDRSISVIVPAFVRSPLAPANKQGYISLTSKDLERADAERIICSELDRSKSAIVRARAVASVLDGRFPGLSAQLQEMLEDIIGVVERLRKAA